MKQTATPNRAPSDTDTIATAGALGEPPFARRVLHSFAWEGGAQLTGQIIAWAVTLVVIRLLTPADYGLMAMTMLLLGFFFMVADFGVGSAIVQAEQVDLEQFRRVLGLIITTSVVCAAVTFWSAPLVAQFFREPRITLLARVLSLNFLLNAISAAPQAQLLRRMDFRTRGKIEVQATAAGALLSLVLAAAGAGVWALVAATLGQSLARAVGYHIVAPVRITPVFSLSLLTPLVRFGAILSVDRIVFFFYGSMDSVIAGKALGEEALGLYAAALAVAAAPMQKIIPTITQVSFAAFARIQSDLERVRRNLLRTVRLASALAFPTLLGMAAVAPVLLPLALGERWVGAVQPFQLLCLILPLRSLSAVHSAALLGTGRVGLNITNMLISIALMTGAFAVGVRFGLLGLALGWALMFPVVFAITSIRVSRALQIPLGQWISSPGLSPLFAAIMCAAVLFVSNVLPGSIAGLPRLALMIATGVLVYGSLTLTADRRLVQELRAAFAR